MTSNKNDVDLKRTIVLFDVDGTLTKSRLPISAEMEQFLIELRKKVTVGLVGGSDLAKIAEQMTTSADQLSIKSGGDGNSGNETINKLINKYDYIFSENGLVAYEGNRKIGEKSILKELGEQKLQPFINYCLGYLSRLELPVKRGNFIEFRTGMINVCPIGRSCSQTERLEFAAYDERHQIRRQLVESLRGEFGEKYQMNFAIGGQISVDCFPKGWDKTFCLQYLTDKFDQIYFIGDRTFPGGNDYEIYADPRTIGYSVTDPDNTKSILTKLFFSS